MTRPYTKPPQTWEQQVDDRLIPRGLRVEDRDRAIDALRRINYYRLSAYWHVFKKPDDTFHPDGSFGRTLELYDFDRRLRLVVLDAIERVEISLRSAIAQRLSLDLGAFAHENPLTFKASFDHAKWLQGLRTENDRSHEAFVQHFRLTYDEFPALPIWVAIELMSFGSVSLMLKHLQPAQSVPIIAPWGVSVPVFESWIHSVVIVRNICAHHARLWNRTLGVSPKLPQGRPEWTSTAIPMPRKVYSILCILRTLLESDPAVGAWVKLVVDLLGEVDGQPRFQSMMGLPSNWHQSTLWSSP